ncbi:MAG: hypothetical protein WCO35_02285 [Candidatus Nomurabacteria bacterium]
MTKEQCNKNEQCVVCLMPKKSDDGIRENKNFCSYCFKDGKICFQGTKKEYLGMVYKKMRERKISFLKAKFFCFMISSSAPFWKKGFDIESAIKGE